MTSGLWAKTGCWCVSLTTIGSRLPLSACAQNAIARSVSLNGTPTAALNHCRSLSTKLTTAMGHWDTRAARVASWSKLSSVGVSRIA